MQSSQLSWFQYLNGIYYPGRIKDKVYSGGVQQEHKRIQLNTMKRFVLCFYQFHLLYLFYMGLNVFRIKLFLNIWKCYVYYVDSNQNSNHKIENQQTDIIEKSAKPK